MLTRRNAAGAESVKKRAWALLVSVFIAGFLLGSYFFSAPSSPPAGRAVGKEAGVGAAAARVGDARSVSPSAPPPAAAARVGDARPVSPSAPPPADFLDGGVGRSLGPPGVFPRARPRVVHNNLFAHSSCQEKNEYVRQLNGQAVVVEVGAFHGEELAMFKGLVKKLWTYEPSPAKFPRIEEAIAQAGMGDVVTFRPVGVSDRDGEATFQLAKAEGKQQDSLGEIGFMTQQNPTRKSITVPLVRLDSEIDERIHLLKIDTQGHELGVVRGAEGIIRRHGIDVIHAEFSPALMRGHGVQPEDFLEYMWSMGYTCSYCNAPFGLPESELPATSGARAKPWGWRAFTADFGELFEIPGHGAWGDLLCI